MPDNPKAPKAETIISAIERLSTRSAELRESAKKNGVEAKRLAEHITVLQRYLERLTKE